MAQWQFSSLALFHAIASIYCLAKLPCGGGNGSDDQPLQFWDHGMFLTGDTLHGRSWRESDKSLILLTKDYEPTCVYAARFINCGLTMYSVCHGDCENLKLFQYAYNDAESQGGNKRVFCTDYHMGSQIVDPCNHLFRRSMLLDLREDQQRVLQNLLRERAEPASSARPCCLDNGGRGVHGWWRSHR